MGELSPRQQAILAMVVNEYINTARPVGSRTIVEGYGLKISSATVRNEMAFLEEAGYLTHLHTSAGRVPTEKGYRYFVERLMDEAALSPAEQRMIRHQFYQVQMDMSEWMKLAAAILARTALAAAIVSPPKARRARLKQLELISVQGTMILAVLVLQGGVVLERMLWLDYPASAEELRQLSNSLTEALSGLDVTGLRARGAGLPPAERFFVDIVLAMMESAESPSEARFYRDGLLNIFSQPEYSEAESIRQVINILESGRLLEALLTEALPSSGVQVIIGGEGRWRELRQCSLILARYGVTDKAVGSLGLLGPLRMPYGRAVSVVRYVAEVLSELVRELYGLPNPS